MSFSSLGASDGPLDEDLDAETLSALDDALLTYYNGVGSTKSDGVFLLSEHGVACLNSLTTLLRDDSARSQPAHFRLGSWSFAAERAVPAIMAYRDRPDVLFAVLRAMVRLTGPLGGDLKHEVAERVRQQQRMKLAFASKDVISALILPLQAPLDAWAAEGGSLAAVPAQQLHYLECLLAVIRNLLSIDNDSGDGGSRSGGASGAHLHDRLVLALSDAVFFPVLGTVILLVLTKGSKNEYLSLLCLEIVYRVLLRESPEDLFPPPPPAHAMAEAAAAKARAAAAAAAAAGASAKAPSGSPLSRSSSGSGSASASASSAAAPGAAPGSSGAPLARSHSASVSSRIAELSARLSASSAAAAATAAAARARAGAPGGGGGSAGRASIAVLSGGIAGPRQVTTLDDLFANTHNSRKDMDLVEKVGGLPIILARGPRMYLHARARDAYRSVLALLLAPVSASSEACMAAASGGAAGPAGPENAWGAIIPCLPFEEAKDTLFNAFLGYTYQKIVSLAQLDVSGGLDVAERAAALRDPLHWLHLAWLGLGCVRTHHDAVRARHAAATAPARKQWAQEQKAAAKAAAVARGAPKAEIDAIDKKRGWESANGGPPGLPPAPRYCFAPAAKVCEDELFNYVLRRLQSAMTDKPVRWEGVERATAALGEIVRSYVCAVSEGDAVTKANAATTRESVIRDEATFTTVRKVIQFYNPTKNGPEHRDRVLVLIHCAYKALELAGGSAGAVTVRGRERTVTVTKKIKKSKAEVEAAAAAAAATAGDDDDDDDEEAAQAKLAAEVAAEAEAEAAAGTATGAGAAEDNGDDAAAAAMKSLKKLAAAAANSNSNENMADDDDVDEIGSSSSSKKRRMLDDASSEDDDDEKEAKSTQKGTQPAADMSDDEGPPPPRRPHSRSQSRSRSRSKSRSKNNDDSEERKDVADGGDDNDDDDGDNDEDSSKKNKSKKKAKKDKEVVVEVIKTKERVHSLLTFGPEQFTESLAQPQVLRQYVEAAESYRTNLPFVNESVFKFLSRVAFDSGRAAMLYNVFTVFLAEEVLNDPLTRRDPSLYRAHDFCRRFAASFLAATARNPLVWVESLSWMTAQTAEFAANPEKYVLENMDRVAEAMEVLQETQGLLTGGSFDPDTQAVVDRVAREEGEEEAAAFAAYIRKTQAESLALSKKKIRKNRGRGGRGGGDGDDDDYIDTFDPSRVGTGAYDDDDDDEYISPAVRALLQRAPGGTASGRSDRAAGRNDSSGTGGEVTGAALAAAGLTRARGRRRDDDEEEVVDVEEALAKARVEAAAKKAAKDAKEAAKAAAAAAKVARKAAAEAKKAEKEERKRQKIAEKRAKRAAQGKNVDESSDGEPDGLSSSSDDEGEAASVESDDDGASAAAAAVVDDDDEEESGFKDKKSSKKDKKDKKSKDKSKSKSKSSKGKDNEEDDAELRRSLQAELALLAQARAASGAESSTGAGAGAGAGRGLKSPLRPSSGNHDDDDDNDGGSVVEEKTAKAGSVKRRRLVGAAFGSGDSPSASATAADAGASAKVDSDDDADVGAAPARRRKVILDDDDDE